jgi:hypothetical protein
VEASKAVAMGMRLLQRYGLYTWTVQVERLTGEDKDCIGLCCHSERCITLDPCVLSHSRWFIRFVLLHELAHALVGFPASHDLCWRVMARRLGIPAWHVQQYAPCPLDLRQRK